jgi:hypothetical protein
MYFPLVALFRFKLVVKLTIIYLNKAQEKRDQIIIDAGSILSYMPMHVRSIKSFYLCIEVLFWKPSKL